MSEIIPPEVPAAEEGKLGFATLSDLFEALASLNLPPNILKSIKKAVTGESSAVIKREFLYPGMTPIKRIPEPLRYDFAIVRSKDGQYLLKGNSIVSAINSANPSQSDQ